MASPSLAAAIVGLIGVIVIVGTPVILIGGLVIIHDLSVSVEDVSLATFAIGTLTPMANSTPPPLPPTAAATAVTVAVTYNLSMTVKVHNPNWFLALDFARPLEARYSFDGALFGPHVLFSGYSEKLRADNTWEYYNLTTGMVGETVLLSVDGVADFARQSKVGVFEVDMVVAANYTVRRAKRSIAATCALKLPIGAPPASSEKVKCV